jgi:hypothetical protein
VLNGGVIEQHPAAEDKNRRGVLAHQTAQGALRNAQLGGGFRIGSEGHSAGGSGTGRARMAANAVGQSWQIRIAAASRIASAPAV